MVAFFREYKLTNYYTRSGAFIQGFVLEYNVYPPETSFPSQTVLFQKSLLGIRKHFFGSKNTVLEWETQFSQNNSFFPDGQQYFPSRSGVFPKLLIWLPQASSLNPVPLRQVRHGVTSPRDPPRRPGYTSRHVLPE